MGSNHVTEAFIQLHSRKARLRFSIKLRTCRWKVARLAHISTTFYHPNQINKDAFNQIMFVLEHFDFEFSLSYRSIWGIEPRVLPQSAQHVFVEFIFR